MHVFGNDSSEAELIALNFQHLSYSITTAHKIINYFEKSYFDLKIAHEQFSPVIFGFL